MRTTRRVFNAPMADEKRRERNRRHAPAGVNDEVGFVGAGLRPARVARGS